MVGTGSAFYWRNRRSKRYGDNYLKDNIIPFSLVSILSDGKFYSGNQLRIHLGIEDCSEISKHINTLREWGIDVFAIADIGYQIEPIYLLNETLIQNQIEGSVFVLPVIDSTNQYLLDHLDILYSGDVCLAEYQKAGRGRYGRKWFSPFGSNLYLSMYWCFKKKPVTMVSLSLVISIILAVVLHDLGANQVRVKWPNDLYLYDRKLAGILIELINREDGTVQAVIGIGINLTLRSLWAREADPHWINLQEIGFNINRNMFAVRLIKELRIFLEYFERNGISPFLPKWKKLDNFINRPVKLLVDNKEIYGISRGINKHGALMLEQNGIVTPWVIGEISLQNMKI